MLRAPGATAFVGCVGADGFAEQLREACRREGVRSCFAVNPALPTGCCAVLTRHGERALCTDLRAARSFTIEMLEEPETTELMRSASVVYCAVMFPAAALRHVAAACVARGSEVAFCANLTAPFAIRNASVKALLAEVLPSVDCLFGNEEEALVWAETEGWETTDVAFVATRLSLVPSCKQRRRTVVITRGSQDTIVAIGGHVTLHPILPVPHDRIVDTNGAGDCYAGGFLAALSRALPLAECCRAGAYAAAMVIQQAGCAFAHESEHKL